MIKYGTNNIGKIYFGSNLIGKAYFGSNLVYSSGSGPGPGPQPTNDAYIRGGADGSYINTGITADNTVKIIIWARNWQPLGEALFGSRASANSNELSLIAPSGTAVDRARFRFGSSNEAYCDSAINTAFANYHKYEVCEGVFSIDDVVVATANSSTFSNNYNIHLFGVNTGGTHGAMTLPADIFACKIYKNNVLVRDFTAVNTPSVGLYDSVSGTMFTNAGSGSFSYGTFNKNAYTPLQYITCSALQYIDTGIAGGYSLPIVAKVSPNSSTPKWNVPVDAGYDTTTRCGFFFGTNTTANSDLSCGLASSTRQMTATSLADYNIVLVKNNNVFNAYRNNSNFGSQATLSASSSYTSGQSLIIGGKFDNGAFLQTQSFDGKIYYVGSGSNGSYVPALVNGVAGMYDTYNDVFHPSESGTAFVAGPEL